MTTVLAALDTSPAARAVLETALGFADLAGAAVEAVHVHDRTDETPRALADRCGVPFRVLDGPVENALLDAIAGVDVIGATVGARATPGGRRPVGHTALRVLVGAHKPVAVVPPEAVGVSPRPFHRLLLPLEGTDVSSRPIVDGLLPLLARDVDLVALHVFTDRTLPRALDHPVRDMALLGAEFLARHFPRGAHIELRTGPIGARVTEVCAEEGADVIVLSWSQDSSAERAAVVREVLARSTVPVLLVPVAAAASYAELRANT